MNCLVDEGTQHTPDHHSVFKTNQQRPNLDTVKGIHRVQGGRRSFHEDLNQEDREARGILWPRIKQAQAEGKVAYFRVSLFSLKGSKDSPDDE